MAKKLLGLQMLAVYPSKDMVAFARFVEERGWDSLWLPEGLWKDPLVELAAIGCQTERIRLGTGISTIFARTPFMMSMAAAALDDISRGRFILGLGTGHRDRTLAVHDVPFEEPVERMRDTVHIIRQALTGKKFSYQGKARQVKDLQQTFAAPSGSMPIYIAALGPKMSKLAGEVADGVVLHFATPKEVVRIRQDMAEGAKAAGRDPSKQEVAAAIICNATADLSAARQEMLLEVARYTRWEFYRHELERAGFAEEARRVHKAWEAHGPEAAAKQVSPELVKALPVAVGVKEIWEKAEEYWKHGVDVVVLNMRPLRHDPIGSIWQTLRALTSK